MLWLGRLAKGALLVVYLCCAAQAKADEAEWHARLSNEAPQAWEELLGATNNLIIRVPTQYVDHGTHPLRVQDSPENGEILIANWNAIVKDNRGRGGTDRHLVENEQYRFEVQKRDAEWIVTELSPYARQPRTLKGLRDELFRGRVTLNGDTARGKALQAACKGLLIYATWLPAMIVAEEFHLEEVTKVEQGVKIVFAYNPRRKGNDAVGDGVVVLDPLRNWQIVEATVAGHWGTDPSTADVGTMKIKNEFNDQKPARVCRQTLRMDAHSAAGEPISTELIWTYDYEPIQSVDPIAFTTAAYGLADPEPDSPRTWFLPILTGSILLFLLVWYIANHLRERRTRPV